MQEPRVEWGAPRPEDSVTNSSEPSAPRADSPSSDSQHEGGGAATAARTDGGGEANGSAPLSHAANGQASIAEAAPEEGSASDGAGPSELPTSDPALERAWADVQEALLDALASPQFETWFQRAVLESVDAERVVIAVNNGFARDWLCKYYREPIEAAVERVFGGPREVDIQIRPEVVARRRGARGGDADARKRRAGDDDTPRGAVARADTPREMRRAGGAVEPELPLQTPDQPKSRNAKGKPGLLSSSDVVLNEQYTFDNFVVGPCNRFAHAAAVGVSEVPGKDYNPFFLHGNVGLGKTHLLQSLCHALLERNPDTNILYLSCETFVNHFISALENGDLHAFRTKYRNVDVLVVDDIHLLANKERTQEEFFHTFNTIYNAGKQIVLSSDSPPKDIPTLQGRLVSRFKWGLVTEIEHPCYETRVAILKRKSRMRGHELPDEVARLLADHIDTNIRELEGAVVRVLGYANLAKKPLTQQLARECLADVFVERRGQPSTEDILRVVTDHFGVKLSDLQSRKRTNAIAFPRQVGMYIARKVTRLSLEEIGGFFGGRDHSTVLYAVQKIERLVREDDDTSRLVLDLESQLRRVGL